MHDLVLHTVPSSPYGRAVMIALEEKGVAWTLRRMAFGDSRSAAHRALHPFGRLPVLVHGDFMLYETQAILRYVDRMFAPASLTPVDPRAAARMDQLMGIADNYLFRDCANVIVFQRLVRPAMTGEAPDEDAIAAALPRALLAFSTVSDMLGDQDYLAGSDISLADMLVGPMISAFATTPEWGGLTAGHRNLADWAARLEERPSFRASRWTAPNEAGHQSS